MTVLTADERAQIDSVIAWCRTREAEIAATLAERDSAYWRRLLKRTRTHRLRLERTLAGAEVAA